MIKVMWGSDAVIMAQIITIVAKFILWPTIFFLAPLGI